MIDTATHKYNPSHKRLAFCGFFPADAPMYSCIVLIAHPRQHAFGAASTSGTVLKNIALKMFSRGMLDNPERLPGRLRSWHPPHPLCVGRQRQAKTADRRPRDHIGPASDQDPSRRQRRHVGTRRHRTRLARSGGQPRIVRLQRPLQRSRLRGLAEPARQAPARAPRHTGDTPAARIIVILPATLNPYHIPFLKMKTLLQLLNGIKILELIGPKNPEITSVVSDSRQVVAGSPVRSRARHGCRRPHIHTAADPQRSARYRVRHPAGDHRFPRSPTSESRIQP